MASPFTGAASLTTNSRSIKEQRAKDAHACPQCSVVWDVPQCGLNRRSSRYFRQPCKDYIFVPIILGNLSHLAARQRWVDWTSSSARPGSDLENIGRNTLWFLNGYNICQLEAEDTDTSSNMARISSRQNSHSMIRSHRKRQTYRVAMNRLLQSKDRYFLDWRV